MAVLKCKFVILLSLLCGIPSVVSQCEEESEEQKTLGNIDPAIDENYSSENVSDLYIHHSGLYLLRDKIIVDGYIEKVCLFGYANSQFDFHFRSGESDGLTNNPLVQLFVYTILYRPRNVENPSVYDIVSKPAMVFHQLISQGIDCISREKDGLDWQVQKGDRIGVFIPDNCTTVNETLAPDAPDVFRGEIDDDVESLCPSQINLAVDTNNDTLCDYAYYLNASLEVNELSDISFDEFIHEQTSLNIKMRIEQVETEPATEPLVIVVSILLVTVVLVVVCVLVIVTLYCVFRSRSASKRALNQIKKIESTHEYNELNLPTGFGSDGVTCTSGYEYATGVSTYDLLKSVGGADGEEHDYDEPYFEPASEVEDLFHQLMKLDIPNIERESLKLHEVLGSGAFGTVYRGVWLHNGAESDQPVALEEEVAVKTVEGGASEEDRVKFLQEAAIMGQFNHPSIIRLLGITLEGELMIVVDLMKGDLRQHLLKLKLQCESEGVPAELSPTLLSFTRQVAFGMLYLSAKSFVHRDLAARNILVSHDRTTCKIADFGLSRDLQKETFYVSHGGKVPVKWTAPEALHYRKYSTASDVWSYGCVLYEIWSLGHKPFQELVNSKVMQLISSGYRLPPPPGCPKTIYDIMIKCWNQQVDERPSFSDIVVSLQLPDFQILKWSPSDEAKYSQPAKTLGTAIEKGHGLYPELQRKYLKNLSEVSGVRERKILGEEFEGKADELPEMDDDGYM